MPNLKYSRGVAGIEANHCNPTCVLVKAQYMSPYNKRLFEAKVKLETGRRFWTSIASFQFVTVTLLRYSSAFPP